MTDNIRFTGAIPALVTPLNADETLNVPVLRQLMGDLLEQGADGFYVGGATGEGIALRREVREQLAEEAVRFAAGRKPCIVHIASADFEEAAALAKHAESCGADAISAVTPLFFRYDEDDVYNYYKALAGRVHIPLMVYYSPMANFPISAKYAARLYEIDNVTSIKWTSNEYDSMIRLKHLTHGEINIINGKDSMLLPGLSAGADGGIGTSYNIMLPRFKAICERFRAGDVRKAHEIQAKVAVICAVLLQYELIPATKGILECMGYEVGNAVFPMKRYSREQKARMYEELKAAGL